jgi:hypothetical protein
MVMKDKMLHMRLPEEVMKEFKIICIEMDLSIPKQTTAIIVNFVKIHRENKRRIEEAKEKK